MSPWTDRSVLLRRRLLAAERGPGVPAGGGPLRIALAYPNTYHVGMSSLGYQIVWQLIQAHPGARAERFFTDTLAWGSLESGAPLSDFDLLMISAAYEMDGPHVLAMIEAAGVPLEARARGDAPRRGGPLILMGGVLVSVNRRPLAPFIDIFAHGEAEVILPPLLDRAAEVRRRGGGRAALLEALTGLPGIELTTGARASVGLPEADGVPPVATAPELGGAPCASCAVTPHTEFAEMALADLARGCPHRCTFCWIGHNAPPYRIRPAEEVLRAADALRPHTDRLGLVASAVGAHPQIDELCRELRARGHRIAYSSLRVEEVSPTMLEALIGSGQRTVTIAPEAGSQRVRRLLGKRITDEQIFDVVERIFGLGAENLKMYFMIGVPSETDDEALEIVAFTERIRAIMVRHARPRGRIGTVGINLGIFVPKPNLPLNHIEPLPPGTVRRRLRRVVHALMRLPNVQVNASSPELATAQAVLSMGGEDAADYLRLVHACAGDWREANRRWRRRSAVDLDWRPEPPRLLAAHVREHATPHTPTTLRSPTVAP